MTDGGVGPTGRLLFDCRELLPGWPSKAPGEADRDDPTADPRRHGARRLHAGDLSAQVYAVTSASDDYLARERLNLPFLLIPRGAQQGGIPAALPRSHVAGRERAQVLRASAPLARTHEQFCSPHRDLLRDSRSALAMSTSTRNARETNVRHAWRRRRCFSTAT